MTRDIERLQSKERIGVRESGNSALVDFALGGLRQCWMPEHGRWSHIYHLDGRSQPNESVAHSDVFYTLNVLLGLSRVNQIPTGLDLEEIFERNVRLLTRLPVATYAYGMALWSAAELKLDVPDEVTRHIETLVAERQNWLRFRAQDIGMLLTGMIAQAREGQRQWERPARMLYEFLVARYHGKSALFFDAPSGYRRRFASFATQTYLTIACYHYGEFSGDDRAIRIAQDCTRRLIELQGEHGEWPWFFDAKEGRVLDFYEVYSVHQFGMAPALLECAERHGIPEARDALVKGFRWILGDNQLRRVMLVPELQLSIRSQVRKDELHTNKKRMLRAVRNVYFPRAASLADSAHVGLRLECRSYELGWILWSFGQRSDLAELTNHYMFALSTHDVRQSA